MPLRESARPAQAAPESRDSPSARDWCRKGSGPRRRTRLALWSSAADLAIRQLDPDSAAAAALTTAQPISPVVHTADIDDVAGIWCYFLRSCQDDDGTGDDGDPPWPPPGDSPGGSFPRPPYPFDPSSPFDGSEHSSEESAEPLDALPQRAEPTAKNQLP